METLRYLPLLVSVALVYLFGVFSNTAADPTPNFHSLNVVLNPGEETCFFQHYPADDNVLLEYKVTADAYQENVIGFQLIDTHGRPLISEFKKHSSKSQFRTIEEGVYKVCFDNTQSRFNKKSVSLRMTTMDAAGTNWEQYNQTNLVSEGEYEGKVGEIARLIDKFRVNFNEIKTTQNKFRQVELRDRVIAERNFERVNKYSAICLLCTVSVMLVQVFSVRSFFDNKSAVQRFLKKRNMS